MDSGELDYKIKKRLEKIKMQKRVKTYYSTDWQKAWLEMVEQLKQKGLLKPEECKSCVQ